MSGCLSRRAVLRAALGAAGASLLAACQSASPQPTTTTSAAPALASPSSSSGVRVASLRTLGEVGQYLAAERGYFAEQGLEVAFDEIGAGELLAALASGQVEVGSGAVAAALFNAIAREVDLRIVGPQARQDPGASSQYLMVRKDLADGGQFGDYRDLAGKKVAIAESGSSGEHVLGVALQRGGLQAGDAEVVHMGFPELTVALGSGAIDLALQVEPTATTSVERGVAVKWREVSDVAPGLQNTVVLFGPRLVSQRTDLGRRWMTAYLKGVRDYHAAVLKRGAERPSVVAVLTRWTSVKDAALYDKMGFPYIDPNGGINTASLAELLDDFRGRGLVASVPDLRQVVDPRFAEAAVQQLGPYPA